MRGKCCGTVDFCQLGYTLSDSQQESMEDTATSCTWVSISVCEPQTCLCALVCCVRAGDWQAAALALTHLSHDAQHQQVLLAVRQERADRSDSSSSSGSNDAGDNAATTGDTLPGADSSRQAKSSGSLRQALRLPPVEQCAGLARSANGPLESVRWALW